MVIIDREMESQKITTEKGQTALYCQASFNSDGFITLGECCGGLTDKNGKLIFEGDICQTKGKPLIDEKPLSRCGTNITVASIGKTLTIHISVVNESPTIDAADVVEVDKAMQFLEGYSFKDEKEIYTNGTVLVPLFRVKQALVDKAYNGFREG